ncbi:hypothetical protein [Sphingomicrobium astaxanthinifaciens]|uniref:hypothetical protein n=1 Tax=Sphingomicrobium astaxanthinifaciens TaxID=1227949 RepID=UPI001FCAA3C1|nr:hypothetical protein [Sphingomicrobium astaxanthinifaciens]MCJ7421844.1 hypothetical protein [Sphingomicrobium astaxanthinifaciens]
MHRSEVESLETGRRHWVPCVRAPCRDWSAMPGCHRHARYLVDRRTMAPSRDRFPVFDSRADCLQWIMRHRSVLAARMPDAPIRAVRLDMWLLGLDQLPG